MSRRLSPLRRCVGRGSTTPNHHQHASPPDRPHDTCTNIRARPLPSKPLPAIRPAASAAKPSIRIVAPANGATVERSFPVSVAVESFRLSAALFGKPNVAGFGHWHLFLDTPSMQTMLGMTAARTFRVSLKGVKPGKHRIIAVLADDVHAPVPGTMSVITVDVR